MCETSTTAMNNGRKMIKLLFNDKRSFLKKKKFYSFFNILFLKFYNSANIRLFKVNNRTLRKGVKHVQS